MSLCETLCIEQIEQASALSRWIPALRVLMSPWLSVLQEDAQDPLYKEETLYHNLVEQLPHLWIAYNRCGQITVAASLTHVVPGQHAYIHGVRAMAYRKHPAVGQLTQRVFEEAFLTLRLHKLKAEFEADNMGALGFCRLYGFTREAYFREDTLIQGQRKDVVVYTLFQSVYLQQKEAMTHHGIWKTKSPTTGESVQEGVRVV